MHKKVILKDYKFLHIFM